MVGVKAGWWEQKRDGGSKGGMAGVKEGWREFLFYKYICKMCILADIKRNCRKSRFI